jgi:hypothetical protein
LGTIRSEVLAHIFIPSLIQNGLPANANPRTSAYKQYSSIIRIKVIFAFLEKRNQAKHSKTAIAIPRARMLLTGASLTPLTPAPLVDDVDDFAWYTVKARFPPQISLLFPAQGRLHEESGSLFERASI